MTKKSKKVAKGKAGKQLKQPIPTKEEPSTSTQVQLPTDAGDDPNPPSKSVIPSQAIIKKCEAIEKLADSIHKDCKISHRKKLAVPADNPQKSVQELGHLASEIKKIIQVASAGHDDLPPPLPPRPREMTDPIVFHNPKPYNWRRSKTRVPHIFVHPPTDFQNHARDVLARNIQMYCPETGTHYTKILCKTFEDHEKLVKYFDENAIPYHTFGHPSNKMMKVVISRISKEVNLTKLKEELIAMSIPVVRLNEINAKYPRKGKHTSILVVVPDNEEGVKVLNVKTIFGEYVKIAPPLPKSKQCHRCQKWGHSQRYCRGRVKCVKCSEEHLSSECSRDPAKEPPRCANCGGEHTASYRRCSHCPRSREYKAGQRKKAPRKRTRILMTLDNCF